jgi:D-alanyl-D-alanine dipeptidase/CubicO group peptidase (beta-lactamase class C family)
MLRSIVLAVALMPVLASIAATNDTGNWNKVGAATLVAIEYERSTRKIPSIMMGIVDAGGLVWSGGAGFVDDAAKTPVNAYTLYRIGGLTQLFTAELTRSFAARGAIDLDAPVQRYLSTFQPRNPFGGDITIRSLLEHRSGLLREPPRGSALDANPATLAETVASLNATVLVFKPGTEYKYSNAGYAVIGRVLEVVGRKSIDESLTETVLAPLQLTRTALRISDKTSVAHSLIAPFDGERFAAPTFDLGVAPSAGGYSNLNDLARFAQMLLMRESKAFGGEFTRSKVDTHGVVGRTGATYGYVSNLSLFPEQGFAVITLMAIDDATPALHRLRDFAARQVLAARKELRKPTVAKTDKISTSTAYALQGHYSSGSQTLDIRVVDQRLFLEAPGVIGELRQRSGRLVVDDLATYRDDIQIDTRARTVNIAGVTYRRADWARPAPSDELDGLVGEYGLHHNHIRFYERDGEAYARVDWSHHRKLQRITKDAYRFPDDGPYSREEIRFTRDERGIGAALSLSGMVLSRRDFGAESEARSRANARFVPELLAAARNMSPPAQASRTRKPELVDVNKLEPGTKLDIRYATADNFLGHPFYESPRFFLQKPAADALVRAHRKLAVEGFGIALFDGYRPWYVTQMFWESVPPESRAFVADPAQGSRHNRGCAADITLFDLANGKVVDMPGRYDEPSSRSSPLYLGGTSLQRWRRDLLKRVMEGEGYDVYSNEWWHFDYGEWRKYPVMNVDFNALAR